MDINQITEELDTLFAQEKIAEIPQFLESHIAQAAQEGAQEVLLTLYNEIIGFYRETGQYALSIENCHKAVALMKEMGIQDTIPYATTLLNIANAHRAAGLLQESLELYNRVRPIYVAHLDENDMYFANFYNNLSLLYQEMGDFASAKDQLVNALSIVSHKPDRQFEAAVTQANLANTCIELGQDDEARARAEEAIRIFEELGVDDAHYSAALSALGSLYYMDKDYNSALRAMEKSRECVAKYLGTDNIQYQRLSENIEIIQNKISTSEKPSEAEKPAQEETASVPAVEASETEALGELPVLETLAAEASELETLALAEEMPVLEAFVPEEEAEPAGVSEQEAFVETPEESEQESKPSQTSVQESFTETPEAEVMPEEEVEQEAETFMQEESGQEAASGEVPELETAVLEESEQESEPAQTSVEESPTEVSESEEEVFVAEASVNTSEVEAIPIEESNGEAAVEVLSTEEPALEPVLEEPKREAFAEAPLTETLEQAASPAKSPEQEDLTPSITGIDLCRRYYEEYGRPMIAGKFQAYESRIAVGLVGKGSDCFGFDDVLSQDHDFGPRFVMWVTKKVYDEIGEELQEAYDKLPSQFLGIDRIETFHGKDRSGVMIIEEFYKSLLGFDLAGMLAHNNEDTASGKEDLDTIKCWLSVQEYALAAAVNGEVFRDDEGIFTQYRNLLSAYYPKAVWYRKAAQTCALFSQSGQYNLPRMRRRGQLVSAELAKAECAKQAMKLYYLLNRKYAPHDKWLYRGMPENAQMTLGEEGMENADVPKLVEKLSLLPADKAHEAALTTAVESLAVIFANELEKLNMVGKCDLYLDVCTKELMTKSDALLTAIVANTPIVTALSLSIAKSEFEAFDKVQNEGGRASCQNNWPTFKVMRMSQYMTWTEDMLLQYLYEFKTNYANGRNMIEEKYARMMESTAPLEYARFAKRLPAVSEAKKAIVEQIVTLQVKWMEEFAAQYPNLAEDARAIHTAEDLAYDTSYETYLRGELRTYSDRMLEMYGRYIVAHAQAGKNVACEIMKNTVQFYGYQDLETANAKSANDTHDR